MADYELMRRYLDEQSVESAASKSARHTVLEHGRTPLSPTLVAHLAWVAAAVRAGTVLQIGSTLGQAAVALHRGSPEATITIIDEDAALLDLERRALQDAQHAPAWIRTIGGNARTVIPRMSEASYDLVLIADAPEHLAAHLQSALALVRPGGSILALNTLDGGRVANPARRDDVATSLRAVIRALARQPDLVSSILPLDGGVLQVSSPRLRTK